MIKRVKQSLTTENLANKFDNQFKMVNCAIKRAEQLVFRGQGMIGADTENPALVVLEEIGSGKDITVSEDTDEPAQALCIA